MGICEKLLKQMEVNGKEGKHGRISDFNPACTWYDERHIDNYRDAVYKTSNGFAYKLWGYTIFFKDKNILCIYPWNSNTTRDRLNTIASFYNLPLNFKIEDNKLYAVINNIDWSFRLIEINLKQRLCKIYIDNHSKDVEIFRY